MKIYNVFSFQSGLRFLCILFAATACDRTPSERLPHGNVGLWLTTPDRAALCAEQPPLQYSVSSSGGTIIAVDTAATFQMIDGFGYSLTGGSAMLIDSLADSTKTVLLDELFGSEPDQLGISYLRISIGASDLDAQPFSYNDLPEGETDPSLKKFSIAKDEQHLIPILREILRRVPRIKIMASPWSAPPWMKTNNAFKGGSLKPEYYGTYADYFVRYIRAMAGEGIRIDAVTIQNEPENPHNTPSMLMTAEEQKTFVRDFLGPAFRSAGIRSKIVVFDHNCDHPEYPIAILDDSVARQYIDGSAFHLYTGTIDALSKVHDAHPDKNIYFTEQWTSGEGQFAGDLQWHVRNLIIGATRNWSRTVLEWNLASDPNFEPHTDDGGCTLCQGALTVGDSVVRNVSYYIIAHASRFVQPGSVRIASDMVQGLPNVAFRTPENYKVLIVLNETGAAKEFEVQQGSKIFRPTLPAGAVATFVWK